MKSVQEVIHLRNTLINFIERFSRDDIFQAVPGNLKKIDNCRKRVKILDETLENYVLHQWLAGGSDIREQDVIDYNYEIRK